MSWETIRFEEVKLTGTKQVRCVTCNKRIRRQRTFGQTLNPYNKRDGRPKTRQEIYGELRARIAIWEKEPVTCGLCLLEQEAD